MADIKVKESQRDTIKTLNKAVIVTEKTKENILKSRDFIQDSNEESAEVYASDKVKLAIDRSVNKGANTFNEQGKKSVKRVNEDIKRARQKIDNHNIKQAEKKLVKNAKGNIQKTEKTIKATGKATRKTIEKSIKTATKTSKKAIKTAENTMKTAQKTAKATAKASKRAYQTAKLTAKATAKTIKLAIKATIKAVKAIIAAVKSLVSAIVAGGWVAVLIIVIICMVGMIASSVYGIFFAKELKGNGNEPTIAYVTLQLENEMNIKIAGIKAINLPYRWL